MITEKQAKIMAQQYCEENQANLFVYHGFVAGVDAALNILLPEINAKRAENTRLNLENAAIAGERDAAMLENSRLIELLKNAAADIDNLKSICDEAIKEARSHVYENERLRAAIQSALTRLENGYSRGAMSALSEAIEK